MVYDDLSVRSVPLKGRPFVRARQILLEEDVEWFVEHIESLLKAVAQTASREGVPDHLCKPLVQVEYLVDIPEVYPRIVAAIGDKAHFFRKEIIPEACEEAALTRQRSEEVLESGLLGALPLVVEDKNSALYRATERVLSSTHIPGAIAELRAEYLPESTEKDDEEKDT